MAAQHAQSAEMLQNYNISTTDAMTSIVLLKDGQVFRGSDAFAEILMTMNPFFWFLGYLLSIFPRTIREYIYYLVSSNRYSLFGKKNACSVPSPTLRSKFIHDVRS
jgi:predicted DCC family thiol-disulfide oxidoreductase YuxK